MAPALGKSSEHVQGKLGRFTRGEDRFQLVLELVGWCLAEDSDVVDAIDNQSVDRYVVGRSGVDGFLRPLVRLAGRLFSGKVGGLVEGGQLAASFSPWILLTTWTVVFGHRETWL